MSATRVTRVGAVSPGDFRSLGALHDELRACRRCLDGGFPIVPGPVFSGRRSARVLLVGQAPGASEVAARRPFHGAAGRRLFRWLSRAGFDEAEFRARHYIGAVTRCYPGRSASGRGDRVPGRPEQALCRRFLDGELALVRPEVVIPVGRVAIQVFLGRRPLDLVVGQIERDDAGRWIVPLPHPSGASRWLNEPRNAASVERALRQLARLRRRLSL